MKPLISLYRDSKSDAPEQAAESHPAHEHNSAEVHADRFIQHADQERRREVSEQVHEENRNSDSLRSHIDVHSVHDAHIRRPDPAEWILQEQQKLTYTKTKQKKAERRLALGPR